MGEEKRGRHPDQLGTGLAHSKHSRREESEARCLSGMHADAEALHAPRVADIDGEGGMSAAGVGCRAETASGRSGIHVEEGREKRV
jgi:hypothetical protein